MSKYLPGSELCKGSEHENATSLVAGVGELGGSVWTMATNVLWKKRYIFKRCNCCAVCSKISHMRSTKCKHKPRRLWEVHRGFAAPLLFSSRISHVLAARRKCADHSFSQISLALLRVRTDKFRQIYSTFVLCIFCASGMQRANNRTHKPTGTKIWFDREKQTQTHTYTIL